MNQSPGARPASPTAADSAGPLDRTWASFAALPRAVRWLVYTGLVLIAYFAVVEPSLDFRNRYALEADALERDLVALRSYSGSDSDAGVRREIVLTHYGDPAPPAAPNEFGRPAEFEAAINEIFRNHAVRKDQTERRSIINLPQGAAILGPDQTLQRQELTLTFEAAPHIVSRIVADLEAERLVTSITRIRIDKAAARRGDADSGLVKATIGVETWMLIDRESSVAAAGGTR